jgi:hypothetical protein
MEVPLAVVQGASLDAAGIAALAGQVELAIAGLLAKTHSS